MSLRELLASFAIEVEDKELKEAHEHIEGFKATLKTVGSAVAEAFALNEIKEFVESQIEAGAQLKVMSDRLGTTTDELQAMQLAAGEAGVHAESLTTGLRFLNRHIAEAVAGGGDAAATFKKLGIAIKDADGVTRPAGDVLQDLADALQAMPDAAKRTQVAMQLLGRGGAELIPLLNQGGEAFERARKQVEELGGGLGEKFVEHAHEAEAAQVRLEFATKGLKSQIAEALLPTVKLIVDELSHLAGEAIHLQKETGALSTAVEFFGVVAGVKALGTMKELAKTLGILKPSVLETIAAFFEFAGPLVAIAALYLVFDDLVGLLEGKDSLIGRALGPDAPKFADDLSAALSSLGGALDQVRGAAELVGGALWDADKALEPLGTIAGPQRISSAMQELAQQIKGVTENLVALMTAARDLEHLDFEGAAAALKNTAIGREVTGGPSKPTTYGIRKFVNDIAGVPTEPSGVEGADVSNMRTRRNAVNVSIPAGAKGQPAYVPPAALGRATGDHLQNGGVVVNQVNNTKIEVHGTGDPEGTAAAVGQGVASENQRANSRARTSFNKP